MKNLFIVLDGMDGTGKTTQISLLHQFLFRRYRNINILTTREPTGGRYGQKIRSVLSAQQDPYSDKEALLDLYQRDRKEHLESMILPFLQGKDSKDRLVLCDRYYYSTIAYQSAQGYDQKKIIEMNKGFRKPDLAIMLDLDPQKALARIHSTRKIEKFESLDFMEKLRRNFLGMKEILKDNILIVNSSGDEAETFSLVRKECEALISQ